MAKGRWKFTMVLPRYAWRRLYEQRLVLLLTVVSFVWPLLCAGFIYLTNHVELLQGLDKDFLEFIKVNGRFFSIFMYVQAGFAVFLAALAGPSLVAPDLSNNALPLYFSRPLTRWSYALARLTVIVGMTLNLGVRWDVQTPGTDPQDRFTTYVPGQKSTVRPTAPTGQLFYGDPGVERGVIPTRLGHVSPRAGFVWDPLGDGKTSIRAAGGIFYGSISGNEWNAMTNFQPWSTRLTFTNISPTTNAAGVPNGASLRNPYNNFVGGAPFPYDGSYASGGGILGVSLDFDWARAYQTNIGVQRQLTKALAVGATYVGTFTRNLPFQRDVNYPVVTSTATAAGANILSRRPNPAFGAVLLLDSDQYSDYNGLQVTFNLRETHHVSVNGFYTLSKTMTSAQLMNNTTGGGAQNYSNLAEDNGRADTDQRHVFSTSVNWRLDYYTGGNDVLRHVINGWSIAPIIKIRSGLPFTVTNGNVDANLDGTTNDRAQLVGDPHLDNPTITQWFNTAAFVQNKVVTGVATDGNSPRNLLDGPGFKVVDLALSRDFQMPRGSKVTFRLEGTNIFNIVNYGQPGAAVPSGATSTTFGVIRTANAMRRLQVGLRFAF